MSGHGADDAVRVPTCQDHLGVHRKRRLRHQFQCSTTWGNGVIALKSSPTGPVRGLNTAEHRLNIPTAVQPVQWRLNSPVPLQVELQGLEEPRDRYRMQIRRQSGQHLVQSPDLPKLRAPVVSSVSNCSAGKCHVPSSKMAHRVRARRR